jgi:hypothetical protein
VHILPTQKDAASHLGRFRSPCTLRKETSTTHNSVIADFKKALIAYRHSEMTGGRAKMKNNNAMACQRPRRSGSPKAVLAGARSPAASATPPSIPTSHTGSLLALVSGIHLGPGDKGEHRTSNH